MGTGDRVYPHGLVVKRTKEKLSILWGIFYATAICPSQMFPSHCEVPARAEGSPGQCSSGTRWMPWGTVVCPEVEARYPPRPPGLSWPLEEVSPQRDSLPPPGMLSLPGWPLASAGEHRQRLRWQKRTEPFLPRGTHLHPGPRGETVPCSPP